MSGAEIAILGSPTYVREARKAKWLSWASLTYMALEGAVAIVAGMVAGSIALIGFGIDSAVEGFASVVIVWRFTGWRTLSHEAEDRAQKLVAIQFFILAPYVGFESARALIDAHHPDESIVGIALAASSLVVMPWLGRAKQRIGSRIGSSATASEGKQNLLCAYLAAALLIGLLGNALLGAWLLDPLVGLLIAGLAIKEVVKRGGAMPVACSAMEPPASRAMTSPSSGTALLRRSPGSASARRA